MQVTNILHKIAFKILTLDVITPTEI